MSEAGKVLRNYISSHGRAVAQGNLDRKGGFRFEDEMMLRIRKKVLSTESITMGELAKPRLGLMTGCDEAFVISKDFAEKLMQQDKYIDIIKPTLRGKDIDGRPVVKPKEYIIYFYSGFTNERRGEQGAIDYMESVYPEVMRYLGNMTLTTNLRGRGANKMGDYWWEVKDGCNRVHNITHCFRRISRNFNVSRVEESFIPLVTCNILTTTDKVMNVMNFTVMSRLHDLVFSANTVGKTVEKTVTTVSKLPIPKVLLDKEHITEQDVYDAFNLTPEEVAYLLKEEN